MTSDRDDDGVQERRQGYRSLPPQVRLEDTIAGVDPDTRPDPEAGRNLDQHRALRDE